MIITNNSPSPGYIAWSGVEITRTSITYLPANGNTNLKYVWWDFSAPTVLQTTDVLPTLEENDALIFVNDSGTHYTIPIQTIVHGAVIMDGTVKKGSISDPVIEQAIFRLDGVLVTDTSIDFDWYAPEAITITEVYIAVRVAPLGSSIIVDVNKNGTTIFTNQANRPEITSGNTSDTSGTPSVTSVVKNDIITIDLDAIGSGTAGEDLIVFVRYKQA